MAVLKDLIVHGPSRFLNAAYYNKIDADEISTNTIALQKITAKTNNTISIVAGLVDVDGELHTKSFTNSNIATIDGSFYITPTISLQGDETNGYTAVATNNSISFSGTSYNLGSAYLDGSDSPIAWSTGSTVIVTGEVLVNNEWIPLGTLKGTLSTYSINTNPNVVGITNILDSVNQSSKILGLIAGTGNLPYRKVKISLISVNRSGLKPLGIYMTAAGSNGRTFLDIYGGNLAESTTYGGLSTPVVRIGNLSGSNLPPVGNVTPNGWGIYTSNGFFSGTMVAKRGIIGEGTKAWTIGKTSNTGAESFLYAPTTGPQSPSANTVGIYIGTDGINNYANSTQYVRIYGGKIYAQGADIQGVLKADTGRIGGSSGWTIASQQISSGTLGSDNSMYLSTKNLSGTVSGKTFDSSNAAWRLTVGSNFGITNTGSLYASEAVISGAINATSLNVGSASSSNHLIYNSTTNTIDLSTDWLKFDSSTQSVIIGKINTSRAKINFQSWKMIDKNGNPYACVVDERNENGVALVQSIETGNGSYTYFTLDYSIDSIVSVLVDNVTLSTSEYTFDHVSSGLGRLILNSAPANGAEIVVNYYTTDSAVKTYTFGVRKSGSVNGGMSFAQGQDVTASGRYSFAGGKGSIAKGNQSHAEGYYTQALWSECHAEGFRTIAGSMYSHAEGYWTEVYGESGHAEGYKTVVKGAYSHAEGYKTITNGMASHAEGWETVADVMSSHAEGTYTKAYGQESHAEGYYSEAHGDRSHVEGTYTKAYGQESHAEGYRSEAHGNRSHASGGYSIASGSDQTVIGKYNKATVSGSGTDEDPYVYSNIGDCAFIIGNGSGNTTAARSNALTVDWNGVVSCYGDVTQKALTIGTNDSSKEMNITAIYTNSGATITAAKFTKKGNLGMLHLTIKTTGAVTSGSNIMQMNLASKYGPIQYITSAGYYGGRSIIGRITAPVQVGNLNVSQIVIRNASSASVTLSDGVELGFTYILNDYFV